MMTDYLHWQINIDAKHFFWLGFDRQGSSVNTINNEVLDELNLILQDLSAQTDIKGLVIYSLKESGFIAGADVHEFSNFNSPEEIVEFLRKGQAVFARLDNLSCPTLAMIDGFCMGGGLELALACDYRLVSERSRIGLPEVMLGIHPGWGGTVRLPKLIGGWPALSQVILPGQALNAKTALRLGILDAVLPFRELKRGAEYYLEHQPPGYKMNPLQALGHVAWVRRLSAKLLRHHIAKRVNPQHYPAPYAVIDLWEKEGGFDDRAYLKEADSVKKLFSSSETAANLIRVFGLKERLKSFSKQSTQKIKRVHVIGAGVMGGDIASWCALQGLQVTLQDQSAERIAPAIARAYQLFSKKLREPRLIQAAMDRLTPDVTGDGLKDAELIIEAVFEDLTVKQDIFKKVEAAAKPDAILATNTSSIPLQEIRKVMRNKSRLIGIHFFNPVAKMELVEVVSDSQSSLDSVARACAFVGQIARLALPVDSQPGFLVNRILMPYLLEAVELIDEGYAPEVIDAAATDFGMLMGPIELADTVGLDICLAVAKHLSEGLPKGKIPRRLQTMVADGKIGKKSKLGGFYSYDRQGKIIKKQISPGHEYVELANRLIGTMLHEAKNCLADGVVADADLIDAAMIFGTGFAPFRGGLMHDAERMGEQKQKQAADRIDKIVPTQ